MNATLKNRASRVWLRMNRLDTAALLICLLYVALWLLRLAFPQIAPSGALLVLAIAALIYFAARGFFWARKHLLWSLRNRLIIAYIFIAVVPVLMLLTMAGLAAYLLYWQLGSYVLFNEMQERAERVAAVAGSMATSYAIEAASGRDIAALALPEDVPTYLQAAMVELPGLKIETGKGQEFLRQSDGSSAGSFSGLVVSGNVLTLRAVVMRPTLSGTLIVSATVPITPELIETLATELGPIQFDVLRPVSGSVPTRDTRVVINRQGYTRTQQISTRQRAVPRSANPFDKLITGIVSLETLDHDQNAGAGSTRVFASFSTRPSLLNRRLFSPLGDLGGAAATALLVIGAVFFLIEIGSLITGVILTRTITTAVGDLYRATLHVQSGDLSFRVRVAHRDQLAALGESFNSMMLSVSSLIEEQRQRQKLENELSIAHEVQQQLFPHAMPEVEGVELEAVCRAARMVSGDYYDFIRISPTRLALALADISGKGISAALLMANVQAVLRSDVLRYRSQEQSTHPDIRESEINTAEIIAHLNRHLYRNSSEERYATFFFGIYDVTTHRLSYTNAGHLPPLYISGDRVERLEAGGTVVGLFSDSSYEQATIEIDPGGLLIAYSDGLIEPENVYGEEFGADRLIAVVMKHRNAPAHEIAQAMMRAAEEWSSSPEQADDMTVVVARLSRALQRAHA